ncbi:VOC family protein [Larkinella terrae]|uniref:VOC family protein n=1 Tax=Larkinella terrae TaxID=2025311 RepID=A0A7K0EQ97_9BACT|nr:VOC family protein [Larkinella terrae]MRS63967.1 VOC family protein [Larkinella terrae]
MAVINPYLNFNGNTEEAFNFYKSVFGGEFIMVQRFKDTPQGGNVAEGEGDKIMHISLPIGKSTILMATDALESMGHKAEPGTNFQLSIGTESQVEADNLFNGLSAGGQVEVPMSKMFWGAYFGMFTDKFGIKWMVSYDENALPA